MKRFLFALAASAVVYGSILSAAAAGERPPQQQLVEGAKKEGEVVLWTHTWRKGAENVLIPFREMYPFLKVKVWDSRTVSVVNKVVAEAKAGKHSPDVILIVSRAFPRLKKAGLLAEYNWPGHVSRWKHQPKSRQWVNIVGNFYLPTYNSNLVPEDQAPQTWEDLKDPRWKGKAVVSSSSSGAPLLFAHMWRKESGELNWERAFSFWSEVINQTEPKGSRGFGGPTELQISGEYPLFLLNSMNIAIRAMDRGAPIKVVRPGEKIAGSSWSLAMPKTVPHPNASQLFIDYLVSPEGLLRYANANQNPVLDPMVAKKADANIKIDQMGIDWYPLPEELLTAENLQKATGWWSAALGLKRKGGR